MVRISSLDIRRGAYIEEREDGNYIFKDEPLWKVWHWHTFMGVLDCYSFHRMTKQEQIEFNKSLPENLQLIIK